MLRRDLDAGRAVTLANMALLRRPADDEAIRLFGEARDRRRAGWGPNETGTLWLDRVIAARMAGSPPPPPATLPWPARRPVGFTDERKLKGAVYLAAFAG
jgi:hypothetical protein